MLKCSFTGLQYLNPLIAKLVRIKRIPQACGNEDNSQKSNFPLLSSSEPPKKSKCNFLVRLNQHQALNSHSNF